MMIILDAVEEEEHMVYMFFREPAKAVVRAVDWTSLVFHFYKNLVEQIPKCILYRYQG